MKVDTNKTYLDQPSINENGEHYTLMMVHQSEWLQIVSPVTFKVLLCWFNLYMRGIAVSYMSTSAAM